MTMMLLGSEGTLGVITKVTLKIHPIPEARKFRAYLFKDFHTAMSAGADLMRSRLRPCAVRLYDETETRTHVQKVFGIDIDSGAYLVFGFDGREKIVDLEMEYAREIMEKNTRGAISAARAATSGGTTSTSSSTPAICSIYRRRSELSTQSPTSPTSRTYIGR